jgi:glyoxylase-like metal-dependent hydrolase (beta-lactamase superfamily II)
LDSNFCIVERDQIDCAICKESRKASEYSTLGSPTRGCSKLPQGGLALIDSGGPGSKARLEQQLSSQGWKLTDIKHILVTHEHYDHVGDLEIIANAAGAVAGRTTKKPASFAASRRRKCNPSAICRCFGKWWSSKSNPHKSVLPFELTQRHLGIHLAVGDCLCACSKSLARIFGKNSNAI